MHYWKRLALVIPLLFAIIFLGPIRASDFNHFGIYIALTAVKVVAHGIMGYIFGEWAVLKAHQSFLKELEDL